MRDIRSERAATFSESGSIRLWLGYRDECGALFGAQQLAAASGNTYPNRALKMRPTILLLLATILSGPRADAQSGAGSPNLTFIPGSSVKLYQVNGDCDWSVWDATITAKSPACKPITSQTVTKADVLGNDVASSFEHNGELIMMFGDTIGADTYYPKWVGFQNTFSWHAHDPIAPQHHAACPGWAPVEFLHQRQSRA